MSLDGDGGITALSATELGERLARRDLTSAEAVEALVRRIESIDSGERGPAIRSIFEIAPDALDLAAARDRERQAGRVRGPLHGLPVLVKDNIDTAAPLHTTAGSLVFGESSPPRDAPLVAALRDAGAIVLGKASMSEWANFRSRPSVSGWSARGGQTRNPHALDRTPGGSSSGSGAALAARLTPLAIGTETDGSVLCPAAACGVAGLKPTVGLVSRSGIVPIAPSQDTAGPMARTVEDLALLLEVMATAPGSGEAGVDLVDSSGRSRSYREQLAGGGLGGLRVGVLRSPGHYGYHPATDRLFDTAVLALADAGAELVDPIELANGPIVPVEDEHVVLVSEFRVASAQYFAARAAGSDRSDGQRLPLNLADVVEHALAEARERPERFGVELMTEAIATAAADPAAYGRALANSRERSRRLGLDPLFEQVDVVAVPTSAPAWLIDEVLGDQCPGQGWSPPAVAGYPSATLPVGLVGNLPVGLTLWAPPFCEARLLRVLYGLEQALGPAVTAPVPAFADHAL